MRPYDFVLPVFPPQVMKTWLSSEVQAKAARFQVSILSLPLTVSMATMDFVGSPLRRTGPGGWWS